MDPSQDIHSNTYTFKNLQTKDAGRYTVKVTNPSLPLLTLESNTISIKVCNVQQDSSELVNLYSGTSGANWTNKTNWLQPGKPISTWHGISTTAEGCVRSINLDNNNLIGSIPALDLNTLDTLILSNNTLSGNIPELKIPFIKYINMRNNVLVDLAFELIAIIQARLNIQSFNPCFSGSCIRILGVGSPPNCSPQFQSLF